MGVFFGSSLHWCTCSFRNDVFVHTMHAIDLVSNTYNRLQLPETTFRKIRFLNVGMVDRRLCVSTLLKDEGIGIWVMEEYGNLESWNKIYCIQHDVDLWFPHVTSVGSNGDKILLMIDRVLAWYDPTKKNVNENVVVIAKNLGYQRYEAIFLFGESC
ncbi:hypothetical protein LINGRAHAP2_LOCUS29202 [Linum grandiflorum]